MATLEEKQARMRERIERDKQLKLEARQSLLPSTDSSVPSSTEERKLCSVCNKRVARRGQVFCSRCTVKGQETQLRDTLPGVVVKEVPITTPVPSSIETRPTIDVNVIVEPVVIAEIAPSEAKYSRKEVARMVGISSTTLMRWEQKRLISAPFHIVFGNKYLYTDAQIEEIKAYKNRVEVYQPREYVPRSGGQTEGEVKEGTLDDFARRRNKKFSNVGKKVEKSLSIRLSDAAARKLL